MSRISGELKLSEERSMLFAVKSVKLEFKLNKKKH